MRRLDMVEVCTVFFINDVINLQRQYGTSDIPDVSASESQRMLGHLGRNSHQHDNDKCQLSRGHAARHIQSSFWLPCTQAL